MMKTCLRSACFWKTKNIPVLAACASLSSGWGVKDSPAHIYIFRFRILRALRPSLYFSSASSPLPPRVPPPTRTFLYNKKVREGGKGEGSPTPHQLHMSM